MKFEYSDLLEKRLVTVKAYANGLKVIKYSKRVFYDALWNADSRLLEARGLVLDRDNTIVARPMNKIFNHKENGTDCDHMITVAAPVKLNGFLFCATYCSRRSELILNTTGTIDSDFVELGKKHWNTRVDALVHAFPDVTFMFEVCDESDPHIIKEAPGIYLLTARDVESGADWHWKRILEVAEQFRVETSEVLITTFGDLLTRLRAVRHEGFMVRDVETGAYIMKLKSPYYLTTKFLARNNKSLRSFLENRELMREKMDEEYYELMDFLSAQYGPSFVDMPEQDRIKVIENYFNRAG